MKEQDLSLIELELRKLGISENAAKIYLVCLQTEKNTIQEIAKKTSLTRPTVYRVLEKMERRGLVKKIKQTGNPFIIAQSPNELLNILRHQKREIDEKEREFIRIISLLKNTFYLSQRNEMEIFPLKTGREIALEELSTTHAKKIFVYSSLRKDLNFYELRRSYNQIKKRLGKIKVFELHTQNDFGKNLKNEPDYIEKKILAETDALVDSFIICDKVIYFSETEVIFIRQENIVEFIRLMFNCLWKKI